MSKVSQPTSLRPELAPQIRDSALPACAASFWPKLSTKMWFRFIRSLKTLEVKTETSAGMKGKEKDLDLLVGVSFHQPPAVLPCPVGVRPLTLGLIIPFTVSCSTSCRASNHVSLAARLRNWLPTLNRETPQYYSAVWPPRASRLTDYTASSHQVTLNGLRA